MSNAVVKSKVAVAEDSDIPRASKPPGGLIAVPLLFAAGVAARLAAHGAFAPPIEPEALEGVREAALLILAAAWVRAFRAHDRGVAWAASTRAKLHHDWTMIARDEGSMLGDDLERARVQRNRAEERNAAYKIARMEYEYFVLGASAFTAITIVGSGAAIVAAGIDDAAKFDVSVVAAIGAGLVLRPLIKLYAAVRSQRSRELSLEDKQDIDAENAPRRDAADKARVCAQFYDDFMRAPRFSG